MQRKSSIFGFLFFMILLNIVPACGDDDDDDDNDDSAVADDNDDDVDDDSADDDSIDDDDDTTLPNGPGGFDQNYRSSSDFFTMMDGLNAGNFNAQVWIWYSSNIEPIIDQDSFEVPEGTTSIQEVDTDADDILDSLTIMVKMGNDYDPENNNWYYEVRDPDGTLRNIPPPGKIQICIECHKDFPATDFLAGSKLR